MNLQNGDGDMMLRYRRLAGGSKKLNELRDSVGESGEASRSLKKKLVFRMNSGS